MPSQIITLIVGLLCVVSVLGYGYAKGYLLRGSGGIGFNTDYLGNGQFGGPYMGVGYGRQYNGLYGGYFSRLYEGYGSYGRPYGGLSGGMFGGINSYPSYFDHYGYMPYGLNNGMYSGYYGYGNHGLYNGYDMGTSNSPFGGMYSRYKGLGDFSGFGIGGGNFGYKKSFKGIVYVLSK
jgi:hypothetical protein